MVFIHYLDVDFEVFSFPRQATGDFCVNPDAYIEHKTPHTLQADILVYYISCESSLQNPFTQAIRRGRASIDEMNKQLSIIQRLSKNLFGDRVKESLDMLTNEVYQASGLMSSLATELECSFFRTKYVDILRSLCHDGL